MAANSEANLVTTVDRLPSLLLDTVLSPWHMVVLRVLEGMDEVNSLPTPSGPRDRLLAKTSTTTSVAIRRSWLGLATSQTTHSSHYHVSMILQ